MSTENPRGELIGIKDGLQPEYFVGIVEARESVRQVRERLSEIANTIGVLGAEAIKLLTETYAQEAAAKHDSANGALRDAEGKLTRILEGTTNQHAVDSIVYLRGAIQEGEAVTESMQAHGPLMAKAVGGGVDVLVERLRVIAEDGLYAPFRKDPEHAALLQQLPKEHAESPTEVRMGNVQGPLTASMQALSEYLEGM